MSVATRMPTIDQIVAQVADGVLQVISGSRRTTNSGAGAIWARDGQGRCLVISNAHVVTADPLTLVDRHGERRPAAIVARDVTRDLALVRVDDAPRAWQPIAPAESTTFRVGQVVMALGHPLGVHHAVTSGVLHAMGPLRSDIELPAVQRSLSWIQLDLRLAPGNSGGPVVDSHGRLVGISTMIARGVGLAIPVSEVDQFVSRVHGADELSHGWTRERTYYG